MDRLSSYCCIGPDTRIFARTHPKPHASSCTHQRKKKARAAHELSLKRSDRVQRARCVGAAGGRRG